MIDDARAGINNLEVEIRIFQGVYDDMVLEIKAKHQLRIKKVCNGDKIRPFAYLVAVTSATELKLNALEARLDVA